MELTRHHRRPRAQGGTSEMHNISYLPANKHDAWNLLFGTMSPDEIAREITYRYLDPDYELVARRKDLP
jgi:hypothetical protein